MAGLVGAEIFSAWKNDFFPTNSSTCNFGVKLVFFWSLPLGTQVPSSVSVGNFNLPEFILSHRASLVSNEHKDKLQYFAMTELSFNLDSNQGTQMTHF